MDKRVPIDRRIWQRAVLVVALIAIPTVAAVGSHRFTDVPADHVFHDDISWLADRGITRGCNPPANTQFCPDEPVTRGQMAAFMRRFSNTVTGSDETGPSARVSMSGTGNTLIPDDIWTTLATTQLTPPSSGGALYVDGGASLLVEALTDFGAAGLLMATVNQTCSDAANAPVVVWSTANEAGGDSAAVSGVFSASSGVQTIRLCGLGFHLDPIERTEAFATISAIWFPSNQVALQEAESPQWRPVEESVATLRERLEANR